MSDCPEFTTEQQPEVENDEFERRPVPEKALLDFKSFLGMYAGEHCAGTELMLGPLFVAAGVSAFDFIVGLLLGNLLAVLNWLFLTAPIATKCRLTLYFQLEKICGRKLVIIYNLANGIMFCFLAGAMITVSATAIGIWFDIPMPELTAKLPNGVSWCIVNLIIGSIIALIAACGYKMVSKIANFAAPWMILIFIVFGLVSFRDILNITNFKIDSAAALWEFAKTELWKGGAPLPGQVKFTFWHVTFMAWFCNLAMHGGMADLTVLRFAKKSWYGIASGAGVYLGHFVAWLCASLMFALQLRINPANTAVLPGPMAYKACGIAGLICVVMASWTTANPTIYRAGMAFQAIIPKISRFWVTFATGILAAVAGIFPAFAMRLLGFVAFYGMVLMPMGAVIFADFYLMKTFKLQSYYAEKKLLSFNPAAAVAWIATMLLCIIMVKFCGIQIYFVSLPGWFIAIILYLLVSAYYQNLDKSTKLNTILKKLAVIISMLCLAVIAIVAISYAFNGIEKSTLYNALTLATLLWFGTVPFWLDRK